MAGCIARKRSRSANGIKILKDDRGMLQGALYPIDEGGGYMPITGTARGVDITLSIINNVSTRTFDSKINRSNHREESLKGLKFQSAHPCELQDFRSARKRNRV